MARQKRKRWYDGQGQSRIHSNALDKASGTRRIASLIILLAMILILIQQTSDVRKVAKVATAIGLLPNERASVDIPFPVIIDQTMDPMKPDLRVDEATLETIALQAASTTVRTNQRIWKALLRKADAATISALSRKLFGSVADPSDDQNAAKNWAKVIEWYDASQVLLLNWSQIELQNSDKESRTNEFYASIQEQKPWFETSAIPMQTVANDLFRGLRLALDERLMDQVVDNSPWWTTDRLPFARSWQRVDALRELFANKTASNLNFNKTDISQLSSGGKSDRGRALRFDGTIFMVDAITSFSEVGFGQHDYFVVWLQPEGTSNQPVCVYVPSENVDRSIKLEKGTHVSVTGFFFKRIAYVSQRGSEVAPLLLAAYVKPSEASGPVGTVSNQVPTFLPSASDDTEWQVPVDTATPYSIVLNRLQQALESMDTESVESGFRGSNVTEAMKPIFELERLRPELSLLLANRLEWQVSTSASIARVTGMVTKVERIAVDSSLPIAQDLQFIYRCRIESGDSTLLLLCSALPSLWLQTDGKPLETIRQPCVVDALRLKNNDGSLVAWAHSPKWQILESPNAVDHSTFLPPNPETFHFLLSHGWDLAWLDILRELENGQIRPFSARELEPYFSLMQIAKKAPFVAVDTRLATLKTARKIPELIEAFRKKQDGNMPCMERVEMNMRIIRISRVKIDNPAEASVLGSDGYFQLDAMADIGNRTYEIKGENEPILYHREYPITCVAIELPSWLRNIDSSSNSDTTASEVQVWYPRMKSYASGWFYRFWSYKTQETSQSLGENKKQIGPLIVLDHLELGYASLEKDQGITEQTASTITLLIGVVGALSIWWFVRQGTIRKLNRG